MSLHTKSCLVFAPQASYVVTSWRELTAINTSPSSSLSMIDVTVVGRSGDQPSYTCMPGAEVYRVKSWEEWYMKISCSYSTYYSALWDEWVDFVDDSADEYDTFVNIQGALGAACVRKQ